MTDRFILNVYFSGTAFALNSNYMTGLLYEETEETSNQARMGFDGCGITNGLMGTLFATGLDDQCAAVEEKVRELLRAGKRVVVNSYGHSRGGVADLMLAQRLGGFPQDLVETNLAMLDPVTGNLLISAKLDLFNFTLANQVKDLSECHNLNRILCLYPYQPLPDFAFHAPIKPTYPLGTIVEEDLTAGMHAGVETTMETPSTNIAQPRYVEFMQQCGTTFRPELERSYPRLFPSKENQLTILGEVLDYCKSSPAERVYHAATPGKFIIPNPELTNNEESYLNHYHKRLARKEHDMSETTSELFYAQHNIAALTELVHDLAKEAYSNLSHASKTSLKGEIMRDFIKDLSKNNIQDRESMLNALRNVLALSLQRNSSFSLFSTTTSAEKILAVLKNDEKFQPLATLIMGTKGGAPRYRDLRYFVLGKNDTTYFNSDKEAHYKVFRDDESQTDVMRNNVPAFLR